MQPFVLLIKPSGSDCNLDCEYCFYKNRDPQIGKGSQRMSYEVLEKMTKDYLALRLPMSSFSWQGGEPTLMGLDFFKRAIELQKKYGKSGQIISNALQTNGILIDDAWCRFLNKYKFLVGISIDGPREFHDYYRKDFAGNGTYHKVMNAIKKLKQHNVEFNALVLLTRKNSDHPDKLIDFFTKLGIKYLQFIPCLEVDRTTGRIADFSVTAEQYGKFLCKTFKRWCEIGPQNLSIRDFESIVSYYVTGSHTICTFATRCDGYIVIEHTGDAFPCDFFVKPDYKLGNIIKTPIKDLAAGSRKKEFNLKKQDLSNNCLICRYLAVCRGGCQKNKIARNGGDSGHTYFCDSYKKFFDYALPRITQIAAHLAAESASKSK